MKTILVADSGRGDVIAKILKGFYEEKVDVYYEKDDRIFLLTSGNPFQSEEVAAGEGKKIDTFFVSGKLILDKMLFPEVLKQRFGAPNSKVVAMSVSPSFIQMIKNGNYGVDFSIEKSVIYGPEEFRDLSFDAQQLLLSFLQ